MKICIEAEIPLSELPNGSKVRCVMHDEKRKFEIGREKTLTVDMAA